MPEGTAIEPDDGADARYAWLVDTLTGFPEVGGPDGQGRRGFGSSAMKVDGTIFAMLADGRLVVNLPRERVSALVLDGTGVPFTAGKATAMKEWLTVTAADDQTWLTLAREALAFVAAGRRGH